MNISFFEQLKTFEKIQEIEYINTVAYGGVA